MHFVPHTASVLMRLWSWQPPHGHDPMCCHMRTEPSHQLQAQQRDLCISTRPAPPDAVSCRTRSRRMLRRRRTSQTVALMVIFPGRRTRPGSRRPSCTSWSCCSTWPRWATRRCGWTSTASCSATRCRTCSPWTPTWRCRTRAARRATTARPPSARRPRPAPAWSLARPAVRQCTIRLTLIYPLVASQAHASLHAQITQARMRVCGWRGRTPTPSTQHRS